MCVCLCSAEHKVTVLSRTAGAYPIKIIGGKTAGVFVSDVHSDVIQVKRIAIKAYLVANILY